MPITKRFFFVAGKEANTAVATKTEESAVTEERIAHILNEASAALRAQQVDESASDESKPPSQTQVNTAVSFFVRRISRGKWKKFPNH
jgi:hypothetical protein